jgi:hypothetical protein
MSNWTGRVRGPARPQELQELRAAAQDLAQQAHHAPGRTGIVFQNVANIAIVGTAVIGGALAAVHLWKAVFPRNHAPGQGTPAEPAGADRNPPRRPKPHVAFARGDEGEHPRHRQLVHQGDDNGPARSR